MTTRTKFRIAAYSIIAIPVLAAFLIPDHIEKTYLWVARMGVFIGLTFYYGAKLRKEREAIIAARGEAARIEIDRKRKLKRRLI